MKYIAMLHAHVSQLLPLATTVATTSPAHFSRVAALLQEGPTGSLLPELAVGMVLLQLRVPLPLVESDCVPLVGELVAHLDQFNRLPPGALGEDEDDLAWPDRKRQYIYLCLFSLLVIQRLLRLYILALYKWHRCLLSYIDEISSNRRDCV